MARYTVIIALIVGYGSLALISATCLFYQTPHNALPGEHGSPHAIHLCAWSCQIGGLTLVAIGSDGWSAFILLASVSAVVAATCRRVPVQTAQPRGPPHLILL